MAADCCNAAFTIPTDKFATFAEDSAGTQSESSGTVDKGACQAKRRCGGK